MELKIAPLQALSADAPFELCASGALDTKTSNFPAKIDTAGHYTALFRCESLPSCPPYQHALPTHGHGLVMVPSLDVVGWPVGNPLAFGP